MSERTVDRDGHFPAESLDSCETKTAASNLLPSYCYFEKAELRTEENLSIGNI